MSDQSLLLDYHLFLPLLPSSHSHLSGSYRAIGTLVPELYEARTRASYSYRAKAMDNRDVLFLITSRLDNGTISSLSRTGCWSIISTFAESPIFWKRRVEHLILVHLWSVCELQDRPDADWKRAYYSLKDAIETELYLHDPSLTSTATAILLELGFDPVFNDSDCLLVAVESCNFESLSVLLEDGRAMPREKNKRDSILRTALLSEDVSIIRLLLEDGRIDPTVDNGRALQRAVDNGQTEIVRLLLEDGRLDPNRINLSYPASRGYSEIVQLLLRDSRFEVSVNGSQALQSAAQAAWFKTVRILLSDKRIDPNADDGLALLGAIDGGDDRIIRLLLNDRRMNVQKADEKYVLLNAAVGYFDSVDIGVFKLLLRDRRIDPRINNNQALKTACSRGRWREVDLLLKDGRADPMIEDGICLEEASAQGHLSVVRLLISDPRVDVAANSNAAVRIAQETGYRGVMIALLSAGARLE